MVSRFILKCLLISLPVLLVFGLVSWVDPYGLFGHSGPVPKELKEKNLYHSGRTMPFSNTLWKMIAFKRAPNPNLMFGDSRLSYFDMDALKEFTGRDYFNFGIPGGNYRTMADLFDYADGLVELKNVYVQVAFRNINTGLDWDLYDEPLSLIEHPQKYVYNRRVVEATALNLYSWVLPDRIERDRPPPDQWERVLETEKANAAEFTPDTFLYDRLRHLAERCKAEGANLVLVEYPTHPDAQRIYIEAGLDNAHEAFLDRLRTIAPVIALDRPGLFPTDAGFWRDPLHLTTEAQRQLIPLVWGHSGDPDPIQNL